MNEVTDSGHRIMTVEEKQKASLETLKHVKDYCDANGIRYYLAYGTLLGAVRHKGFIPWDDDVDLHIPRPDYERLLSEYHDDTGQFKLVSCFNDRKYFLPFAKIKNCRTARLNPDGSIDPEGIGIDLFPLDGIPDDIASAKKLFERQNNKFIKVINRMYTYSMTPASSAMNTLKLIAGKAGMKSGFVNQVARGIAKKMYKESYSDCLMVACVTGIHSGRFLPFSREWFNPVQLEFEGEPFSCPAGYHEILKKIYGDYMVIPPEADRQSTHTEKFVWRYE